MDYTQGFGQMSPWVFFVIFLWSLLWRGLALWRSAQMKQRNWFIVLLIVNTFGILDIAYLFYFAKKRMKVNELKFWETR